MAKKKEKTPIDVGKELEEDEATIPKPKGKTVTILGSVADYISDKLLEKDGSIEKEEDPANADVLAYSVSTKEDQQGLVKHLGKRIKTVDAIFIKPSKDLSFEESKMLEETTTYVNTLDIPVYTSIDDLTAHLLGEGDE